jgi:hypothetical protein
MFGIDDLAIASMIASAAIQQQTRAAGVERQRKAAVQSQQRALASQNQATDVALKQVQEFDPGTRKEKQDQIQQDLTAQYEKAASSPITAQGVQVGATIQDAAGSTDYLAAKARETAKAAASNRSLAALFGRIGSAGQLRQGEAVGIGDAAGEIGRIQTGANNVANIDQIGIDAAGQPSLGGMLVSSALGAYGMGRASLPTAAVKSAPNILAGSYANPNVLQVGSWLRK